MELRAFFAWIVSGGGAGILAYLLVNGVEWLASLPPKTKRIAAFAVSALIAMGIYALAAFAGYQELPVSGMAWVENLFLVGSTAFGLSQLIHVKDLKTR